jgi:hypothetical protein
LLGAAFAISSTSAHADGELGPAEGLPVAPPAAAATAPANGDLPVPAASTPSAPAPPPGAAPAAAAPVLSVGAPSDAPRGEGLPSLQQRVGDLKEQIFRAKARLSLLSERFLRSTAGGGRAVLQQKIDMGRLFLPVRITYLLDGREIFTKADDKGGLAQAELPVWDGSLKPGDHTLTVEVVYRGRGTPVFSYFSQYTYTASAAQRFSASDGGTTRISVLCHEKGNPALTDVADRPLIEFQVSDGSAAPPSGAAPATAKAEAEKRGSP